MRKLLCYLGFHSYKQTKREFKKVILVTNDFGFPVEKKLYEYTFECKHCGKKEKKCLTSQAN